MLQIKCNYLTVTIPTSEMSERQLYGRITATLPFKVILTLYTHITLDWKKQ